MAATPYSIAEAFERIENTLLDSMMRNFKRHRAEETAEGYNWTAWQAEQLKALNEYKKRNRAVFPKQFAEINQKIDELIDTTAKDGEASAEAEILKAIRKGAKISHKPIQGIQGEFFKLNDRKLDALIKATHSDFVKAEHAILRRADDIYRKAIFNAQAYANTGAGTYAQAVDMAVRDMMRAGLDCVEYKNGARHTLSNYAEMAIRTANKRANLMGEGNKRAEWGIHTVVVNHRYGACALCAPFVGKIFIDDVYSGGKKGDGNYPLLSNAIREGLFHPNCKDGCSTWFEGISRIKPVTPEEEEEMNRREKLAARQNYYENQAEKCERIAEHSLDKDNKKIYERRAKINEENAEKIAKALEKSGESGIIKLKRNISSRHLPNGWRSPSTHHLADDEIEMLKREIEAIEADLSVFKFNEGTRTGYDDVLDEIRVKGDILPDLNSEHPRDRMSPRAALAHEYYGHRANRGTRLPKGSWNDEFRASYMAAKKCPNLTLSDRRYLILDALERAKEKGVTITYNSFIRGLLYGY